MTLGRGEAPAAAATAGRPPFTRADGRGHTWHTTPSHHPGTLCGARLALRLAVRGTRRESGMRFGFYPASTEPSIKLRGTPRSPLPSPWLSESLRRSQQDLYRRLHTAATDIILAVYSPSNGGGMAVLQLQPGQLRPQGFLGHDASLGRRGSFAN